MLKELNLRIVLQNPVGGAVYGLQKGKGAEYQTVQAQLADGQDLTFDFTVGVKEAKGSIPTLAGPFVQGPAGGRFIYIGIGTYAGQRGASCSGRIKVPLPEETFQSGLSGEGKAFWSCTIPGQKEDGKPVFATVKPFSGWAVHKGSH